MKRTLGWAPTCAVIGCLCGGMIPLPVGTSLPASSLDSEAGNSKDSPESVRSVTPASVSIGKLPCVGGVAPPLTANNVARADWLEARAAFEETWGAPMSAPPGLDPTEKLGEIEEILDSLRLDFSAVDCQYWPCVAVLVAEDPVKFDALESTLGVQPGNISMGEVYIGDSFARVATVAFGTPRSRGEERWAFRLQRRLQEIYHSEIYAVLEE